MGHRALVAVERENGKFDCYRSRWGGETVFERGSDRFVANAISTGELLETGSSVRRVLELLEARGDEVLVVRSGSETTRYLVRWLGVPTVDGDGAGPVVLVPVADGEAMDRLDCVLQTATGILGDAVDAGLVPWSVAVGYLSEFVARHPDVPDETLWIEDDFPPVQTGDGRD